VLRFPLALADETRLAAGRLRRSLWWRTRPNRLPGHELVRRAWARTDPDYLVRAIRSTRGALTRTTPTTPPPRPGTEIILAGELNGSRLTWSDLLLDGKDLDYSLILALGVDMSTPPFPVTITVRVGAGLPSRGRRDAALADQVVAAAAARHELEKLCRAAGADVNRLLAEAAARARAATEPE
jgi:hypothetical protein